MIYDEISKELIEFISNPIQNMQYLEKKESKFKIMFNLSSKAIIGEYINKLYPKIFFERELFYFLKVSQNEIEKLKSIDYPINKINFEAKANQELALKDAAAAASLKGFNTTR